MSFELGVEVKGAAALAKRMRERPAIAADFVALLGRAGARVERGYKERLVPGHGRRTGRLANSARFVVDAAALKVRIGPSAFYGAFVEFGTGRRGADSGVKPFGGYAYGSRAGMAARPALQPALADERPIITREMKELGEQTAKRIAGK